VEHLTASCWERLQLTRKLRNWSIRRLHSRGRYRWPPTAQASAGAEIACRTKERTKGACKIAGELSHSWPVKSRITPHPPGLRPGLSARSPSPHATLFSYWESGDSPASQIPRSGPLPCHEQLVDVAPTGGLGFGWVVLRAVAQDSVTLAVGAGAGGQTRIEVHSMETGGNCVKSRARGPSKSE
jgi:hypothetical protein